MKISGFTIARNAVKYNYPIIESIKSILPICDEFIVNVGKSDDDTLDLIKSIKSSKIKIIETEWDFSIGKEVLSEQTNIALNECTGDWAFYLQSDEVVHEDDLPRLKAFMLKHIDNEEIDALRFKWFHFYGSYWRYRIDKGWYQKQDRIIRNNGTIESYGDAYAFRKKNGTDLKRLNSECYVYHYGWVHPDDVMAARRKNAHEIGFVELKKEEEKDKYCYGDLKRFPVYFGSHPRTMKPFVENHQLSVDDRNDISRKFWWHPARFLRLRVKTGKRVRDKI